MLRNAVVLPLLMAAGLFGQTVETIPLRAILSGENETQQPASPTTGVATVWLHVVRDAAGKVTSGSADATVSYNFAAPGTITAMHIHRGAAGTDGPVVVPFAVRRTEANGAGLLPAVQTAFPSTAVSLDTITAILADPSQFYYNVHTTDFPAGVMRAQLQRADQLVRMGLMIPENEAPPIASRPWASTGTVLLLTTRNAQGTPTSAYIIFDVAYRGFPAGTMFTGLHIHRGAAQTNGPVTIDSGLTGQVPVAEGGAGVLHYENEVDLNRAGALETVMGVVNNPAGFYINVHTAEFPGGAARSQLLRTDQMEFQVNLSTAGEVPPITDLQASTAGKLTVYTVRNPTGGVLAGAVVFDVNPSFPADTQFTGLHIHDGLAGVNGPVTIDSRFSSFPVLVGAGGSGNIYRIATVGSGAALATLNSLIVNPSRHYVNIHTSVYRGGATRVQLAGSPTLPKITFAGVGVPGATFVRLAPGSTFIINGTSLTNVATDLSGFNGLQVLPSSLNGVSVTIDGIPAPLSYVSATEIRGQVPFEVGTGRRAIVVTTPGGASDVYIADIASASPAIAFGPNGVLATRADGSAVTAANPASAGEVIYINVIGLGQTTPALQTGGIVPSNATFIAGPLDARIGGYNTTVLSAVAAPGQVGVYRVAIVVPQGIQPGTGNAPLLLQLGLITSNVVALPVR